MTHEFRTPVNSILALTRLLAERLESNPDQKDELFYIRKSAQQLSDLVDDLLDLAKVEAGKIDVRPAPFEVSDLFGALRGMLRPLLVNQSRRARLRGCRTTCRRSTRTRARSRRSCATSSRTR